MINEPCYMDLRGFTNVVMQYYLGNDGSIFLPLIQAINTNMHRFHKKYMV